MKLILIFTFIVWIASMFQVIELFQAIDETRAHEELIDTQSPNFALESKVLQDNTQ